MSTQSRITERGQALILAAAILDRPQADPDDDLAVLARQLTRSQESIDALEKLVYVPGQWRCPKCNFRLTQSNLYVASGTVGPRDEAGDKCPNCNGPLWRVSAMDDRNEAFKTANDMFDRAYKAETSVSRALELGVICGRMLAVAKCGNETESLQEGIMTDAGLTGADKRAMNHQVTAINVVQDEIRKITPDDALYYGSYMLPASEQAELKALTAATPKPEAA
jgi:hypothetical protein